MYILPSVGGGIFLPFKGEKKHIKHYILRYELFSLHRFGGYPTLRVLILFLPESTEGVDPGQVTALDYENEANRTEKWEKRDKHWAD